MGFLEKFKEKVTPPKVHVSVVLKKPFFSIGENLEGVVQVLPSEEVDCDEIRCEITCVEKVRKVKRVYNQALKREVEQEVWDSAVLFSSKPQLCGPTHLSEGVALSFPFSVPIPPHLPPYLKSLDRRVEWSLKGVVAVRGRPDATSKTVELVVVQRELAQQPQPATVACKYCGAVYSQNLDRCPNCGAPRTA